MNDVIRVAVSSREVVESQTLPGALLPLPAPGDLPGGGVTIRDAVASDLPFIDALQKKHSKAVGWMPTAQLEGHVAKGNVLIAEEIEPQRRRGAEEGGDSDALICERSDARVNSAGSPAHGPGSALRPQRLSGSTPVGYCIGVDKYFKREDVGIIYQMNITPGRQRGLVGATLLKAMFDRWPYGVRLCCCWCAQDLQANYFWEAMGFVPLAFRAGGRGRSKGGAADKSRGPRNQGRVHIFWQKMIRKADQDAHGTIEPLRRRGAEESRGGAAPIPERPEADLNPASAYHPDSGSAPRASRLTSGGGSSPTSYWYPSQTGSGAIREDRIVLPIPPGTHWSDAKPRVLPPESGVAALLEEIGAEHKAIEGPEQRAEKKRQRKARKVAKLPGANPRKVEAAERISTVASGGLRFSSGGRDQGSGIRKEAQHTAENKARKRTSGGSSGGRKNDPRLVAAARELRDRWMEQVNTQRLLPAAQGKYDVSRALEDVPTQLKTTLLLGESA